MFLHLGCFANKIMFSIRVIIGSIAASLQYGETLVHGVKHTGESPKRWILSLIAPIVDKGCRENRQHIAHQQDAHVGKAPFAIGRKHHGRRSGGRMGESQLAHGSDSQRHGKSNAHFSFERHFAHENGNRNGYRLSQHRVARLCGRGGGQTENQSGQGSKRTQNECHRVSLVRVDQCLVEIGQHEQSDKATDKGMKGLDPSKSGRKRDGGATTLFEGVDESIGHFNGLIFEMSSKG
mmetsp:Transcript_3739/g.10291  ORF Transcript_3739/g.10291 Transcript_3739/m.10291 type:complete len:236 (-) Transcript_3739:1028-1735(-)